VNESTNTIFHAPPFLYVSLQELELPRYSEDRNCSTGNFSLDPQSAVRGRIFDETRPSDSQTNMDDASSIVPNAFIDCGNTATTDSLEPFQATPRGVSTALAASQIGFDQTTSHELPSPSSASDSSAPTAASFVAEPGSPNSPPYSCSRCPKSYDKQHELK
jgi:hypothetical protein